MLSDKVSMSCNAKIIPTASEHVVQYVPDDEVCTVNLSSTTAVLQNPPIAHHCTSAQMTTATPWKVLKKKEHHTVVT